MIYHNHSTEEVLKELGVRADKGLSDLIVKDRQVDLGPNKLKEKPKKTMKQRFIEQFKDVMILILLAAAAVSFVVAIIEGNPKEFFEPVLILAIVILNAVMGVMQESKAEEALEALMKQGESKVRVLRNNGKEYEIPAEELVPGDIMILEAGSKVAADARLIESTSVKCEESALTGESVPSDKDATIIVPEDAGIGDRDNMLFSGCCLTNGNAKAVVTAIGMDTEMGKIANLLNNEVETQTPLQQKLAQLGKYLGVMAIAACAIILAVGIANGIPTLEIFMTAISLAVSAIPEGLPAIVTVVLSIGVTRMVKKNAIIRRLPAVETLGSASVICSDKTGTLTQNKMTLVEAYVDNGVEIEDIADNNTNKVCEMLMMGTLCSTASIDYHEDGSWQGYGDPTEIAILDAAHKNHMSLQDIREKHNKVGEIPFDSDRKLMTTINNIRGVNHVIVKGAFDVLASRCIEGNIEKAKEINDDMSRRALRVIAVAYKTIDKVPPKLVSDEIEKDLIFIGLVGMIDPPRPEAKAAVTVCKKAGIRPVMITGDHVVTASAIAKQLGILNDGDKAITGRELDLMNDSQLDAEVEKISVYARVSPENKIRIVKAWQRKGQVVSMTGDGVNDAPALKAADIGCAMGITGTDVAKGAADMTLTDDNFATIVDAVKEGRGIYANIKKVVGFLLGTNIGEVVTVFMAMVMWHKSPLLSMQLLWINLVTDSLPAIALGMEPVEQDIMTHKPKPKDEGLFAHGFGVQIILQGLMFGILALVAFWLGYTATGIEASGQTMAFLVLAISQVIQAYNMRSSKSIFKIGIFSNKKLNIASFVSIALVILVAFTPIRTIFGLVKLTKELYLIALGMIFVPVIIMEFAKLVKIIRDY